MHKCISWYITYCYITTFFIIFCLYFTFKFKVCARWFLIEALLL